MTAQPTTEIVSVEQIDKWFGRAKVLSGITFAIRPGEILGLIGPNGAGKTTLLECLAGLLPTNGGEVRFEDKSVSPNRRRSVMSFIPEGIVPYPEQHVRHVVSFYESVYGETIHNEKMPSQALDLAPVMDHRVRQLSKGWRRRLLLALGLRTPQPILLIDEPFDGLDLRQTREVMDVFRNCAASGRTLLLSIHQLIEAERICDRFVLLSSGQVVGEGSLEELRTRAGVVDGSLEDIFLALS